MGSLDYHKFRCTVIVPLNTNAVGQAHPGEVNSICRPYRVLDETFSQSPTLVPTEVTGLSDITSLFNLFDSYRVQYCKISYTPRHDKGFFTQFSGTPAQGALTGMPRLYIAYDVDDIDLNESRLNLAQRSSCKVYDLSKSFTYKFKPRRINMISTSIPNVILENGWMDKDTEAQNNAGTVLMKSDELNTVAALGGITPALNFQLGELLIEYYVEFKNRR